jgi:hypothetical protein
MTALQTVSVCVIAVGVVGLWGYSQKQAGIRQAQAADRLRADSVTQDSTLRAYRGRVAADSLLLAQNRARMTQEALKARQEGARGDSLEQALRGDTGKYVLRDSAVAVVAAKDSVIAHLTLANVALQDEAGILLRGISSRDSTIQALSAQLTGVRHDLAVQLGVHPSVFAKALTIATDVLAVRGAVAFAFGR